MIAKNRGGGRGRTGGARSLHHPLNPPLDHAILSDITLELSNAISFSKAKYHERLAININDLKAAPKTYWSLLKTFFNDSKIPLVSKHLHILFNNSGSGINECFPNE